LLLQLGCRTGLGIELGKSIGNGTPDRVLTLERRDTLKPKLNFRMLPGICIVVSHFQSPAGVFPVIWLGTCGFTFHSTFQLTFAIAFVVNFMAFSFAAKRLRCSFPGNCQEF